MSSGSIRLAVRCAAFRPRFGPSDESTANHFSAAGVGGSARCQCGCIAGIRNCTVPKRKESNLKCEGKAGYKEFLASLLSWGLFRGNFSPTAAVPSWSYYLSYLVNLNVGNFTDFRNWDRVHSALFPLRKQPDLSHETGVVLSPEPEPPFICRPTRFGSSLEAQAACGVPIRGASGHARQWVVWVNAELVPETPLAPYPASNLRPPNSSPCIRRLGQHGFASLPFPCNRTLRRDVRLLLGTHDPLGAFRVGKHDWPRDERSPRNSDSVGRWSAWQ
jgi:hypothetical protein